MRFFKKRYKSTSKKTAVFMSSLVMCILFLSIGFSSLSASVSIGASATVRIQKDIRVTNIKTGNTVGDAYSNWEDYNVSNISTSTALPNANSTITYDVEITNIGNAEMGILSITGLPSNLTYSISNYDLKDTLCDDNTSTQCKLGAVSTLHITIGYANNGYNSSNINYNLNMNFEFKQVYSISYSGFSSTSGLPTTILDGETKNITFTSTTDIPVDVAVDNATANYSRPTLTLSGAVGDIIVTRKYSVTYVDFPGNTSGLISMIGPEGGSIAFNSTTGIPELVTVTGALSSYNLTTHILTLTSVTSDVVVTMEQDGIVEIKSVTRHEILNITENSSPQITNDGQGITFDLGVTADQSNYDQDFYVTYAIVIDNDSVHEQKVLAGDFTPNIVGTGNLPNVTYNITDEDGQPVYNTTIAPKTSQTYYLTINVVPQEQGSWGVEGETTVTPVQNGTVTGSISGSAQGDLTGSNSTAHFTANVINSYDVAKTFTLSIDDSKFAIVDSNGNAISSMNIAANTSDTYDFYIKNMNGNSFISSPYDLDISITSGDDTGSIGTVTLAVDIDSTLTDETAPVISNLTATQSSTNKEITLTWRGSDDNTISKFYVETYTSNASGTGTLYNTDTVNGAANNAQVTHTVTVPTDNAYYYFKVYGEDQSQNKASDSDIASCGTTSGHCMRTSNEIYKWQNYTVTLVLTNATSSQGTVSTNGNVRTYTITTTYDTNITNITLSGAGNNYNAPSSIETATITYPNGSSSNLSSGNSSTTAYSYNNGTLNLYHIKGDIRIEASGTGTCLAEGTKILLANGSYKNVEDIGYDDLLAVWNYDTGELTYEYPLWIEKKQSLYSMTKVTFSDDSYINFVGNHAVYDMDKNTFINIINGDDFKEGIRVAKLKNNKLVSSTIKSIEYINKDVNYYFIGSTTYYNVFANDVLTTDRNLMISNLYGFDKNAKWPKEKARFMADENNLLDYSYFEDVLPYYLYKGFRVREAGYLVNNNMITLDMFKKYITTLIINPKMIETPITKDNDRYWMVTTSEDNVNDSNKEMFLRKESSTYILPKSKRKDFKGWINTADNVIYQPGDKIAVSHGIHFRAIYKNNQNESFKAFSNVKSYLR